jgi:hypothetical protein
MICRLLLTLALVAEPGWAATPSLPADAEILLEVVQPLSSRSSMVGQSFQLRVLEPVSSGDSLLIPAGATATGEVIHAQKSGKAGRPGELIVAARYLDLPGGRVKLRSTFGSTGASKADQATATYVVVGTVGLLIQGKDTVLPVGARMTARLADRYEPLATPAGVPANGMQVDSAKPDPADAMVGGPAEGKALVVFFRPRHLTSPKLGFKVREGANVIGFLKGGELFTVQVDPGPHTFSVQSEVQDALNIEVEAGETHFVLGSVTMGWGAGRFNLSPSDASVFAAELPGLKLAAPRK